MAKRKKRKASKKARRCIQKKLYKLRRERLPFRQMLAIAYSHCRAQGFKLPRKKK